MCFSISIILFHRAKFEAILKNIFIINNKKQKNRLTNLSKLSLTVGAHANSKLSFQILSTEASFEKSGQYPAGTVFIEGLVFHQNKWFLYYGCADSRVAVAVYDPNK
ncbi:hypothetical protein [Dysgonomonas sp. Marseille-P4361]|uniref:hypothetical protein n=1 Tax=Dysgonomonas sp. Marseille-P4361 TaxID=2161820 RepID=UPI001357BDF2|nr:hypothetical protein [Dysgonomonas sp. Marseille-P4361]